VREVDYALRISRDIRPTFRVFTPWFAPRTITIRFRRKTLPVWSDGKPNPIWQAQKDFKDRAYLISNDFYFDYARTLFRKLAFDPTILRSLRQQLGAGGPRVLTAEQRAARGVPAPLERDLLLSSLPLLDFDDELRVLRRPLSLARRHTPVAALSREARVCARIDKLPKGQQRSLCGVVYVLLITALALTEIRWRASQKSMTSREQSNRLIDELLCAVRWLYGKTCARWIRTLACAGIKEVKPSSSTVSRRRAARH
jgi:hypothetical protein